MGFETACLHHPFVYHCHRVVSVGALDSDMICIFRIAGACLLMLLFASTAARGSDAASLTAFSNFVKAGNYENANFYLSGNFVKPEDVDTSQLFFDVFMDRFSEDLTRHAQAIDALYNYLNAIKPITFNRAMRCGRDKEQLCLLANNLLTGARRAAVGYFVDRGMDLNLHVPGLVPTTLPVVLRLGSTYSIEEMNYFVSRGLVLGDEVYSVDELIGYQDSYLYDDHLNMPTNYLTLANQNLLDVLVIALGTRTDEGPPRESARRQAVCDFIMYAAQSFSPSFDYLLYLLREIEEFRGSNIGRMERHYNRTIYQPFPTSCVTLIQSMAANHAQLTVVINGFAGEGDVDTANWLINIRNGQQ